MIKCVIFDLGKVIVNYDEGGMLSGLAIASGKPLSYVKKYHELSSLRKSFERGELSGKEFYKKIASGLSLKITFNEFKKIYCGYFTLNVEVADAIKKLSKKYRLVLLSNTDELHFGFIKGKFKIINEFNDRVLSYKIGLRKPNPLIFIEAIKKSRTMPWNCAYFDDIPEFTVMARLLGIKAFQFRDFNDLKKVL